MNRLLSITLVCLLHVSMALASAFNLAVEVTPVGAGSLNTSGGTYEEGSSIYLYTYRNTGYVFKGWYEGDQLVSSSTSFNYTMPSHDATLQARYEYDPTVPGDPAMPDTTTYYTLTTMISPNGAGSLNIYSGRYAAGADVYLYAYRNTGFKFLRWQDDEGKLVSESTSFSYTMPQRNVQLTAVYDYDPDVPANPDSMATRYTVTVKCKPMGGGSFNTNQATAEEGANVRLYAYTNTGYKFLRWEDSEGNTLSEVQDFYYVMPHGNEVIYGVFDFDPATPSNPAKNFWNKELGEVIVDDFTPNDLNTAVRNAIGDSQASEVAMITVVGRMGNYDFGIANNYENCTLLDLSRVTGVTEIPSYAFDYAKLESVYLPATVEKIGYHAFYECTQLISINLYAMTPPELDSHVFDGVPEGLVVYVPAAAIAQYQENEAWSQFTLMPIKEDIRNLTVQLPEGTNVADYAQMWLELTNTKNGQHMHYVMTDRMNYTFANIIRNTEWNVVLRSQAGDVFGQIDNVKVEDDDVTVTFASLTRPQNVSLTVMAGEEDVTQQVQVAWMDADGNYLAQGTSLTGLPVGRQVVYRITLNQDLAMAYQTPAAAEYTLKDGDNNIVCQLTAIPQLPINAYVKDMLTGLPIIGATVSASQTFDGRYSRTLNTKTNELGQFTLTVSQVPTQLTIAAPDYVSQTLTIDKQLAEGRVELPNVNLKSIVGATITLGFTYTSSAPEGQEPEVQGFYSDYQNVNYTIYNQTSQSEIGQFNVQYPQIVLLEEVADGDVLALTATSRTGAFNPVTATVTIDGQRASATFPIVELGGIKASFQENANQNVVGMLYDGRDQIVNKYEYDNGELVIPNVADGQYTLVTMGYSRFFNNVNSVAQYAEIGLKEGEDYVMNKFEVQSGRISSISNTRIPYFNESKLYYTGENTSFTCNKSQVTAGQYITLIGKVDFKPAYSSDVNNVKIVVDLPEGCMFVDNSVMVGRKTATYEIRDKQLIVPLADYAETVKFCVLPTKSGDLFVGGNVNFALNDESITQPIGWGYCKVKSMTLNVPQETTTKNVVIGGTATPKANVKIYDNGILIGNTKSIANGNWSLSCALSNDYDCTYHSIYAEIESTDGLVYVTENKKLYYNSTTVEPVKVTMLNYSNNIVLDLKNPSASPIGYTFNPSHTGFTFLVDMNNPNSENLISSVNVNVTTSDGEVAILPATYDRAKKTWVAISNFTTANLPVSVSVSVKTYVEKLANIDASLIDLFVEGCKDVNLSEMLTAVDGLDEKPDYSVSIDTLEYSIDNAGNLNYVRKFTCVGNYEGNEDFVLLNSFTSEAITYEEFQSESEDYIQIQDNAGKVYYAKKINEAQRAGVICVDLDNLTRVSIFFYGLSQAGPMGIVPHRSTVGTVATGVAVVAGVVGLAPLSVTAGLIVGGIGLVAGIVGAVDNFNEEQKTSGYLSTYSDCLKQKGLYDEYRRTFDRNTGVAVFSDVFGVNAAKYGLIATGMKASAAVGRTIGVAGLVFTAGSYFSGGNVSDLGEKILEECGGKKPKPDDPKLKPYIDPSGFVYEGVFSNRVQGATATVFYKEMVEDMYGDLHENIVKWDAEEYAQENPLFTDENGYYQWDVPTGLWQVKFEKEGYETTYSEWLPVPPPQLDVNIAMTQNVQPNVRQARAYEDAVEIEFDKYMIPDGLTTENITVLQNDEPVEGSIQLLNEEVSYEGQTDTYASRVRFNAAEPFSAKEITLVVKNRVQSYAGIRMQDDFLQKFAVELEVKQIVCDSLSVVTYGESKVIQVSVLPALASAGRTLNVATSSDMMLTLENKSVTIGEDGTATIIVTGELPGTAALTFTVSGSEVSATSVVSIEQAVILPVVALPLASIASGSQVEKGTEVFLSCETEGATIYYTLDGSCPCDENAQRYVYDGTPIVVNDSVTIRVMAVADGMVESEIAEYTYTVKVEDAIGDVALNGQLRIYPLPVRDKLNVTAGGNIIRSVSLYTVGGALVKRVAVPSRHVVLDTSSLAPGVYTVSVATEQQTVSRKVVKID